MRRRKYQLRIDEYDRAATRHLQQAMPGDFGDDSPRVGTHLDAHPMQAWTRGRHDRMHLAYFTDGHLGGHRFVDVETGHGPELRRNAEGSAELHLLPLTREDIALNATNETPETRIASPTLECPSKGTRGGVQQGLCLFPGNVGHRTTDPIE